MSLLSIEVICDTCDERYGILIESETRNDTRPCDVCPKGTASRAWSVPHVSTEKLSHTIPDAAARGRFDGARVTNGLKRDLAAAKKKTAGDPSAKNYEEVKRTRAEIKKHKAKGG